MSILKSINNYNDFKKINKNNYKKLANEIRDFIIELGNKKEIHYSSNLGIIETTISILSCFDINHDIVVYDTGHQTYPHKILTGRFSKFNLIRQHNGVAGLLDMYESKYDHYSPGHCSNSLSILQGYFIAEQNKNKNYICVVGDAALSNGLFLESLNIVGHRQDPLIIILNDNQMSISESVGSLNESLNYMKQNKKLIKLKSKISSNLLIKWNKFNCNNFFTSLNYYYIGQIDGHNLKELENAINLAKKIKNTKPVVIHVKTKKGFGCKDAINDKCGILHSKSNSKNTTSFGKEAANYFEQILENNNDVKIINPAMNIGSGFINIYNNSKKNMKYYNKYFDVGINEEYAISLASGFSIKNKIPFVLIYSTFLQRTYDQLLHDVARLNLKLNLLIDRADLSPGDGPTHHGIFDVSFLSTLPNTIISSPRNYSQLKQLIDLSLNPKLNKIFAIRYPRAYSYEFNSEHKISLNTPEHLIDNLNYKIAIISYGPIINDLAKIIIDKNKQINLINAIFINSLSNDALIKIFKNNKIIFCYERIYGNSGLYKVLINFKNQNNLSNKIFLISYNKIPYFGDLKLLDQENKMDLDYLFNFIEKNS